MNEYIYIPEYFNVEAIDCKILEEFLKEANYIDNRKININSLRKYYSSSTKKGIILIDELKLRGFEFVVKNSSALLDTIEYDGDIELIYTKKDDEKISKINKNIFNYFDYKEIVENDFYFNLIPIHGFRNITKDFNYDLVKQEFVRYGYQIVKEDELKFFNDKKSKDTIGTLKYDYNLDFNKFLVKILKKHQEYEEQIKNIRLITILPKETATEINIRTKLRKERIRTIGELMNHNVDYLLNIKGINSKGINEFKTHILESIKSHNNNIKIEIDKSNHLQDKDYINSAKENKYLEELEGHKLRQEEHKDKETNQMINKSIKKNEGIERIFKSKKLDNLIPSSTNTDRSVKKFFYKKNILTIYDLINFDLSTLREVRSVGTKKIDDIKSIIIKEIESIESGYEILENGFFHLEEPIFSIIKDYTISEINNILYDNKFYFDEELLNKNISYCQNLKYKNIKQSKLALFLNKLTIDLKEILSINNIIKNIKTNKLSERDKEILHDRVVLGKTLEEVGQGFNLTRERIRQIENKTIKRYNLSLRTKEFIKSLKLNFKNNDFFYINDLKKVLEKENLFILGMIMNGYIENIYYYKPLERVYFKDYKDMDEKLEDIINELADYGDIEEDLIEVIKSLAENFGGLSYEESIKLLEENGLTIMGTYYFKGKKTNNKMLEIIYKYVHKTSLTLNDKGAKLLNKYFNDIFNYKIEHNVRNWDATTSRIPDVMLVGPKTYMHLDHISINSKIIKQVKDITDATLQDQSYVYAERLFEKMNIIAPNNNIISKHHIYSIIKYYYSEFYQTSTGNSLRISKKGAPDITNSEFLYNKVLENDGVLDFEIIKKATKWEHYRIDMAISTSEKLIKLGSEKVVILDKLFKKDEKARFIEILEDDMELGYTTTDRIYIKFRFDEIMSSFLTRNNIKKAKEIASIMKGINDKIRGHNVFMYYENQKIKSIRDVISDRYPVKVYRNQIIDILNEFNMLEDQISYHLKTFLVEKQYIQISREEYLNYKNFDLDEEIIENIISFFNEIYKQKGFIVPEEYISEIARKYKSNEYGWNQFTISAILAKNGYKKLERFNSDYRYEIIALVKENKNYDDISYLMYDLIKNEYKGTLHELPVYEFLSEKSIYKVEIEDYKKKLQLDAKENDLISVDVIGNIKLKE